MKSAYVYLQLYRLFDEVTPLPVDCGKLCSSACCQGEDAGMLLFPGEEEVYKLFAPEWVKIEETDMTYTCGSKEYTVNIAFCNGECDRFARPLACRIFPLTPHLDKNGELEIITDPRAMGVCRIAKLLSLEEYDPQFIKNIKRVFKILLKNKRIYSFFRMYSEYIDEYGRFFK